MMNIPYLALIVGAVASFLLGMLWYSPFLFGPTWAQAHGFSEEKMKMMHSETFMAHIIGFITVFVTGFIIWQLLGMMNIQTIQSALWVGFLLWLGFPAAQGLMSTQYSGKPFNVFLIDTGYQLAYILTLCAVIFYLRP